MTAQTVGGLERALRALDDSPSDARRLLDALGPRLRRADPAARIAAGLIAFEARRYDDALGWMESAGAQRPVGRGIRGAQAAGPKTDDVQPVP